MFAAGYVPRPVPPAFSPLSRPSLRRQVRKLLCGEAGASSTPPGVPLPCLRRQVPKREVLPRSPRSPACADKSQSYFVGDAAGRPTDFVDSKTNKPVATDREFAANIGIQFKVPEDVFG